MSILKSEIETLSTWLLSVYRHLTLVTPEVAPQAPGSPETAPTLGTLSPGRDDFFSSHFPLEKVHPPQSLERVLQLLLQSSTVL